IVNVPKRGLGDAALQTLQGIRRAQGVSLFQAARLAIGTEELRPQARRALADLVGGFERWQAQAADLPHPELAEIVLDESGYVPMWKADKTIEAPGRLENLRELIEALAEFDSL